MNVPQRSDEKAFGAHRHPGSPSGTVGYSQTNIQVAGVDEPDIIKNDDKYIYTISGSTLAIIDAYPAAGASVISKTEIADTPKDIFVNGDRLVLFSYGNGKHRKPLHNRQGAEPASAGNADAPVPLLFTHYPCHHL